MSRFSDFGTCSRARVLISRAWEKFPTLRACCASSSSCSASGPQPIRNTRPIAGVSRMARRSVHAGTPPSSGPRPEPRCAGYPHEARTHLESLRVATRPSHLRSSLRGLGGINPEASPNPLETHTDHGTS